jgi:hypothetical protein
VDAKQQRRFGFVTLCEVAGRLCFAGAVVITEPHADAVPVDATVLTAVIGGKEDFAIIKVGAAGTVSDPPVKDVIECAICPNFSAKAVPKGASDSRVHPPRLMGLFEYPINVDSETFPSEVDKPGGIAANDAVRRKLFLPNGGAAGTTPPAVQLHVRRAGMPAISCNGPNGFRDAKRSSFIDCDRAFAFREGIGIGFDKRADGLMLLLRSRCFAARIAAARVVDLLLIGLVCADPGRLPAPNVNAAAPNGCGVGPNGALWVGAAPLGAGGGLLLLTIWI